MQVPLPCVCAIIVISLLEATVAPSQGRPMWRTDIGAGTVSFVERGSAPRLTLALGGFPWQVRADLDGRAVVKDAITPVIHLVAPLGNPLTVPLPGPCVDAVPDGSGGAFALLNAPGACSLVHVDPQGQVAACFSRPGAGIRLRLLADGTVLIAGLAGSVYTVARLEIATGHVVSGIVTPRGASDIAFDDSGNLVISGVELDAVPIYTRALVRAGSFRCLSPVAAAQPLRGGGAVVTSGWPPRVDIVDAASQSLVTPYPTPWAGAHTGLADGSVLVSDVGNAAAIVADPGGVFTWYGSWPSSYGKDDGAGMDFARSFALELDPDLDGFATAVELREGTDPGSAASRPVRLGFDGPFLDLVAPAHPLGFYLVAAASTASPGAVLPFPVEDALFLTSLEPGAVFGVPFGLLDGGGAQRIAILPPHPYPAGVVVGAAIFVPGAVVPALLAPAIPAPTAP